MMTNEQAKAAVTEGVLSALQQCIGEFANALVTNNDAERKEAVDALTTQLTHLRHVEAAAHGVIDRAFAAPKEESKTTETDEEYRHRLRGIVGPGSIYSMKIETAVGVDLDRIGANYSAKRR